MNKYFFVIFTCVVIVATAFFMQRFGIMVPVGISQSNALTEKKQFPVTGKGKLQVIPDIAYIDFGISVSKVETASQAQQQIDTVHNNIVKALVGAGIQKTDIKTQYYNVQPNYTYNNGGNSTQDGYNANANVTVAIHDTTRAGEITKVVTDAGANEIQNTRFAIEDMTKYRAQVRSLAIADAKQQARQIAQELGVKLGKILSITEGDNYSAMPMPYARVQAIAPESGSPADLQVGSQDIESMVTLYYEMQ